MGWATPALGTPDDVILDYRDDGVISESHSSEDLWAALERWRDTGTAAYGAFADAVDAAFDAKQLGLTPENRAHEVVPPAAVPATVLPVPPDAGTAGGRPPAAFFALSALALLLLIAGGAAAVARRGRGDPSS